MKRYKLTLVFAGGVAAGIMLSWALCAWLERRGGGPGGEALVPLCIGLLVYVGYCCRDFVEAARQGGSEL